MPIDALGAPSVKPPAKKSEAGTGIADDFEGFLKLLTTQLTQQDPTSPMDTDKFTAQLVQFSTVEQAIRTNDRLSQLIGLTETGQATAALDYLGTKVQIEGSNFALPDAGGVDLAYSLPEDARSLAIEVLDGGGKTVRLLDGPDTAGRHALAWDGRDQAGNRLPAGAYSLRVTGLDADKAPISATVEVEGTVEAIERVGDALGLVVDGQTVPLSVVRGVRPATAADTQS